MIVENDVSSDTYSLNKTWKEIHDAYIDGTQVIVHTLSNSGVIQDRETFESVYTISISEGFYSVLFGQEEYSTDSENGYPGYSGSE